MDSKIVESEEKFHDEWASYINIDDVMVDESFEACTAPENRRIILSLGDIKGKTVLELGAGAGESSVYLAKKGANVIASDISEEMLNVVTGVAKKHNVKVSTLKASCDSIPLDDDSIDIVYAGNVLHHVDIEKTINEVIRVLKKNGTFVCWEPVAHNPIINVYRRMASNVRTDDEHPLKIKDIKKINSSFSDSQNYFTWFFTLNIFIGFWLKGNDPNETRYWKKILTDHKKIERKYNFMEKMDNLFLKIFPFMKRFCWNVVIISHK